MHYYQHHIGDFIKDTAFLTNEEVGIYLKLLWIYYDTESPLPDDLFTLSMKLNARDNEQAVSGILKMFFTLKDGYWYQSRCEEEISSYKEFINDKSKAGKASAIKRALNKNSTGVEQVLSKSSTDEQLTNNHKPITNNQEPLFIEAKASLSEPKVLTCPQQEILKLWGKHLPHLTQPRSWEGNRQTMLKQRWIQASKPSNYSPDGYNSLDKGLAWWDSFFAYIANDTSLAKGFESKDRTWRPDLEWVVNATNFQKIIDGKYNK